MDWRKRGRKGKRDLLRAVRSRLSKSNEAFKRLAEDPDEGVAKKGHYPSDDFLWQSEQFMLSRYCNFLLQSILILARVFQVPTIMNNTFVAGMMTSARVALFFCHSTEMKNQDALNLRSLQRHMYARMLTEAESRDQVEAVLKNEWDHDRNSSVNGRIDQWLPQQLQKGVTEGRYPLTNLDYDVDKQWDHVWQELELAVFVSTTRQKGTNSFVKPKIPYYSFWAILAASAFLT